MGATLLAGVALAAVAWGALFGLRRTGFWTRAAVGGLAIGAYAVLAQRDEMGDLLRPRVAEVAIGVGGAVALYAVFWAGDALLRRWVPKAAAHVDELYQVQTLSSSKRLPVPVVVPFVGVCEELFWRGFVQARAGFVLALAAYAAVHLWERKAVLILAAAVGGAFWGGMFVWRDSLVAPIVSHALWDLAVVVWFPFGGAWRRG